MAQPEQAREYVTTHFDKVLYTAKSHTTGGRDNGASRTDDGRLDARLLFQARRERAPTRSSCSLVGWSACYLSAIKLLAEKKKVTLPNEVAMGITHGMHGLAARLNVNLPGMDRQTAQELAEAAHHVCPYSRATHGNINVTTNVVV